MIKDVIAKPSPLEIQPVQHLAVPKLQSICIKQAHWAALLAVVNNLLSVARVAIRRFEYRCRQLLPHLVLLELTLKLIYLEHFLL